MLECREQMEILERYPDSFYRTIEDAGVKMGRLNPLSLKIFQMNITKKCNLACRHCHVAASPRRREMMTKATMDLALDVIGSTPQIETVDLTGGAPELHPHFRWFVKESKKLGKHVIDRCNLVILEEEGFENLHYFLAENGVEILASLPHYAPIRTDRQRGRGVHEKSIRALRKLNDLGYGRELPLNLVYNPTGAFLSGSQSDLEKEFKKALDRNYGITFDNLFCINNMPLSRFLESLIRKGMFEKYMETLVEAFNPATLEGLMCRHQVSVDWDGRLYDCDFNQVLGLSCNGQSTLENFTYRGFMDRAIRTSNHCYGCTAGAGSSCGGEIADS